MKANAKKPSAEEKKPRKKREAQYNRARHRLSPTQIVEHRIVACPDCHLRLGGISLARLREVIDVPPRLASQSANTGSTRDGVPAHNNLAERSVRPRVIARKISGGSRSPKGSQTRMGLASLFGTWVAQQLNPFRQCLALLTSPSSLG